jgi:cytochrome d ubiquinol oxidase subunit I
MVGLGTIFVVSMAVCAWRLRRGRLYESRRLLWLLLVLLPFPWIANVAGWTTAELGRQPWTVHGIQRTSEAYSENVSSGNALFTLIGFMGLYALLALVFVGLLVRAVLRGPSPRAAAEGGH